MANSIDLSYRQSLAWKYLEDNITTEIGYGGAAGGGKSFLGCLWQIHRRKTYPNSRGLIGRSKLTNLKQSTLVTFFKVADMMGYKNTVDYIYNAQDHIITFDNGSIILFKDLFQYPSDPDFTSLGSTEFTDAFIDEMPEITEKAFEILQSRLRWMVSEYNLVPKILGTCNPQNGWVKLRYIKDKNNNPIQLKPYQQFIQALVTDNPDKEFVRLYEEQLSKLTSDYDRQRLLHGDWDIERGNSNPFFYAYEPSKHESNEAVYREGYQIYMSIDFNMNPFAVNFAHLWRDTDNIEHVHVFDEMSIDDGNIIKLCERIKSKYSHRLHQFVVTGDAMGNNRNITERDNASNYDLIKRNLGLHMGQMKQPRANPTHSNSRADCNLILTRFPDIKFNPETCPNTCRDMRIVEADAFGSILKKNRTQIAQQADHADNIRYLINTFLQQWISRNK